MDDQGDAIVRKTSAHEEADDNPSHQHRKTSRKKRYPHVTDIWLTDLYLPGRRRLGLGGIIVAALLAPLIALILAERYGRWDWFERSGAITETIGLALAAGRQIRLGVLELAALRKRGEELVELHADIISAKAGFALSAFGTVVWGWGLYLREWCFLFLVGWLLFVNHLVRRDFARVQAAHHQSENPDAAS